MTRPGFKKKYKTQTLFLQGWTFIILCNRKQNHNFGINSVLRSKYSIEHNTIYSKTQELVHEMKVRDPNKFVEQQPFLRHCQNSYNNSELYFASPYVSAKPKLQNEPHAANVPAVHERSSSASAIRGNMLMLKVLTSLTLETTWGIEVDISSLE